MVWGEGQGVEDEISFLDEPLFVSRQLSHQNPQTSPQKEGTDNRPHVCKSLCCSQLPEMFKITQMGLREEEKVLLEKTRSCPQNLPSKQGTHHVMMACVVPPQ